MVGLVDWALNLGRAVVRRVNKVKHAHQQQGLCPEPCFVVRVCKDKEDILQNRDEKLVEEGAGRLHVRLLRNVVDQLEAHVQACGFDISVVVLARPHARIDDKLELAVVEFQQCWYGQLDVQGLEEDETYKGSSEG